MARIYEMIGVVLDGSDPPAGQSPLLQQPISLTVPQGEDVLIKLTLRTEAAALYNLTGCTVTFGVAMLPTDSASETATKIQRNYVNQSPLANGVTHLSLVPADTLPLHAYDELSWDTWLTAADATRQRIVPLSAFKVEGAATVPGTPVTAPVIIPSLYPSGLRRTIAQPADGSDFIVTLPVAYPDDTYIVTGSIEDSAIVTLLRFPNALAGDRTTTQFRCITGTALANGDTINIIIGSLIT
jgi:hypothetical protein